MANLICSICANNKFREGPVLWSSLIDEWELNEEEVRYVDRQQGCSCTSCGANLRFVALGKAILSLVGTSLPLCDAVAAGYFQDWRILDCNGAGPVSDALAVLPKYVRADYPESDLHGLAFGDGTFDLVIHSDTLEHVENPLLALKECRRVLSANGHLCFTVPVIVGRRSRSRKGLPPSYHGDPTTERADFLVQTEFGADVWTMVLEAGFAEVKLNQVDFPSATAITASSGRSVLSAGPWLNAGIARDQQSAEKGQASEIYDQDGLQSVHNHEFLNDPKFKAAYARGVQAAGCDYRWHWRVHVGLWAATTALSLPGDFVEFGVNRGFLSSAIMKRLDWNTTGRRFYLLDTFSGVDERYINDDDRDLGVLERNKHDIDIGFYTLEVDEVRKNFAEWPRAEIIIGPVPETLSLIDSSRFAFAHIDMNCAPPEVAAAEFLWARMTPGGIILLDDYAYQGYRSQKLAMDQFAESKGVSILSLPTGQGLLIKLT